MGVVKNDSHIGQEPPLPPHKDDPDVASPFNAYSGSGNVTVVNRSDLIALPNWDIT